MSANTELEYHLEAGSTLSKLRHAINKEELDNIFGLTDYVSGAKSKLSDLGVDLALLSAVQLPANSSLLLFDKDTKLTMVIHNPINNHVSVTANDASYAFKAISQEITFEAINGSNNNAEFLNGLRFKGLFAGMDTDKVMVYTIAKKDEHGESKLKSFTEMKSNLHDADNNNNFAKGFVISNDFIKELKKVIVEGFVTLRNENGSLNWTTVIGLLLVLVLIYMWYNGHLKDVIPQFGGNVEIIKLDLKSEISDF